MPHKISATQNVGKAFQTICQIFSTIESKALIDKAAQIRQKVSAERCSA
jgi:hypothetical protein